MDRRIVLKAGLGVGALAGVGALGRYAFLAPPRSERLESVAALAVRVFGGLPEEARAHACVLYDHPLRQYHNRGLWAGGLVVHALTLDWKMRCALTDLFHAGLSEIGRMRIPNQFGIPWAGVNTAMREQAQADVARRRTGSDGACRPDRVGLQGALACAS